MIALRDKYDYALRTAKNLRMAGSAEERGGKLYLKGVVGTKEEVNKIWDAIKTVPDWRSDMVADIRVSSRTPAPADAGQIPQPVKPPTP